MQEASLRIIIETKNEHCKNCYEHFIFGV